MSVESVSSTNHTNQSFFSKLCSCIDLKVIRCAAPIFKILAPLAAAAFGYSAYILYKDGQMANALAFGGLACLAIAYTIRSLGCCSKAGESEEVKAKKAKIENIFSKELITALGGIDKILTFPEDPVIEGNFPPQKNAPITICYANDSIFLAFSLINRETNETRYEKINVRKENSWLTSSKGVKLEDLNLIGVGTSFGSTECQEFICDKIKRLTEGKGIGSFQIFEVKEGLDDDDPVIPTDSYLKDEQLKLYMDYVITSYYELEKPSYWLV